MADATASTRRPERPLSPHLQIYRWSVTMFSSVFHRATGIALGAGTLLVAWWLIAAATGEAYFNWVNWLFGTWIGRLVLFGYTWALMHHMLGGLRHFMWDMGHGYEKHFATRIALLTPVVSITLTVLIWIAGYLAR